MKKKIVYKDNKYTVYFNENDEVHVERYGATPTFQEFNGNVVHRLATVIAERLGTVDVSTAVESDNVVAINLKNAVDK